MTSETAALITLLRIGRRPWRAYAEAVEDAGGALAVLENERAGQTQLFADEGVRDAESDIAGWASEGIHVVTVLDAEYPENLRAAHDRPPLIFVAGTLREQDHRSVAVVGARAASSHGLTAARAIAIHLVSESFTVTSGLAAGIDTAAHTAALGHGGRTMAVIGTGLRRCYPPQNAALQRRIAREHVVISQFWPDAPPTRQSFPMRNALMSGLTLATVVVEAAHTSGSRIQARLALSQGRPVFLVDRVLEHEWARQFATRPGVHVIGEPAEITGTLERLTATGALTR